MNENEELNIAAVKNKFVKKKQFTRFIKGRISFSKKSSVKFEILKGQESFRIKSFNKSNVERFINFHKKQLK